MVNAYIFLLLQEDDTDNRIVGQIVAVATIIIPLFITNIFLQSTESINECVEFCWSVKLTAITSTTNTAAILYFSIITSSHHHHWRHFHFRFLLLLLTLKRGTNRKKEISAAVFAVLLGSVLLFTVGFSFISIWQIIKQTNRQAGRQAGKEQSAVNSLPKLTFTHKRLFCCLTAVHFSTTSSSPSSSSTHCALIANCVSVCLWFTGVSAVCVCVCCSLPSHAPYRHTHTHTHTLTAQTHEHIRH